MKFLTIETTCDETPQPSSRMSSKCCLPSSRRRTHSTIASAASYPKSHLAHMFSGLFPLLMKPLRKANIKLTDLDAVAVANTPGLAGSLLIGLTAAKTICLATGLPLLAINHLQAHIYACRLASGRNVFPCVGLVVSGGHSNLYRCEGPTDFTPLGGTIDDAAGEAFDKVASLLGLPYPGGPSIERTARNGDASRYRFPRPLVDDRDRLDFSFSGLKTAVRYQVAGVGKPINPPAAAKSFFPRDGRYRRQFSSGGDRLSCRQSGSSP